MFYDVVIDHDATDEYGDARTEGVLAERRRFEEFEEVLDYLGSLDQPPTAVAIECIPSNEESE